MQLQLGILVGTNCEEGVRVSLVKRSMIVFQFSNQTRKDRKY